MINGLLSRMIRSCIVESHVSTTPVTMGQVGISRNGDTVDVMSQFDDRIK